MIENRRKLMVCLRNRCNRCKESIRTVPDSCEYSVLHALDCEQGIQKRDRQSGKTTQLIRMANELCSLGYTVYYVAPSNRMLDFVRASLNRTVKTFGFPQMKLGWIRASRDLSPGLVLADEIQGEDLEFLEREMVGSLLVAAYYTPL